MVSDRIGFMQGRLSPLVNGRIQAFPAAHWRDEFPAAARLGLGLMEWTLDHEGLDANPLMTEAGRDEIRALGARHGVAVETITGDLFMQQPFWKAGAARDALLEQFDRVADAAGDAGAEIIVVPLVDNGSIVDEGEHALVDAMLARANGLRRRGVTIAFESDFPPDRLAAFIARFPPDAFGVNYDTGNSAALGYDCGEEIAAYYGGRILNVHVKDRLPGGTTVPLGTGAADLPRALKVLRASGYAGRYILQTARAADGDHEGALARYRDMTRAWLAEPFQ
jgi:hexulose-6-phosphate isomerase